MTVRLSTGPVSWGVDFADAPDNPPWELVLDEIGRSGYRGTELGPLGYLPAEPRALTHELHSRGLEIAGSFIFEPLHDPGSLRRIVDMTRTTCELIAAVGGRYLVVIDLGDAARAEAAGRPQAAPRLGAREWSHLCDGLRRVATVAREEFGLIPVLHPHAGTYVEFEDEVDRLLAALSPLLELCVDTGHCAYSGIDPVALYRRYSDRVPYLHLKDVDAEVHRLVVGGRLDYWGAIEAGVFCPLGSGLVDFEGLASALAETGFDGWATVEQDRRRGSSSDALADAIRSRRFLERLGIGAGERVSAR